MSDNKSVHTEPQAARLPEINVVRCGPVTSTVIGLPCSFRFRAMLELRSLNRTLQSLRSSADGRRCVLVCESRTPHCHARPEPLSFTEVLLRLPSVLFVRFPELPDRQKESHSGLPVRRHFRTIFVPPSRSCSSRSTKPNNQSVNRSTHSRGF